MPLTEPREPPIKLQVLPVMLDALTKLPWQSTCDALMALLVVVALTDPDRAKIAVIVALLIDEAA